MPRTSGERSNSLEMQPRMTLSSASHDFRGKSDMSSKVAFKAPPKEEASRMGFTWGYGVGVVRGKYVTSTLNAPTNVLSILMGKDS